MLCCNWMMCHWKYQIQRKSVVDNHRMSLAVTQLLISMSHKEPIKDYSIQFESINEIKKHETNRYLILNHGCHLKLGGKCHKFLKFGKIQSRLNGVWIEQFSRFPMSFEHSASNPSGIGPFEQWFDHTTHLGTFSFITDIE